MLLFIIKFVALMIISFITGMFAQLWLFPNIPVIYEYAGLSFVLPRVLDSFGLEMFLPSFGLFVFGYMKFSDYDLSKKFVVGLSTFSITLLTVFIVNAQYTKAIILDDLIGNLLFPLGVAIIIGLLYGTLVAFTFIRNS